MASCGVWKSVSLILVASTVVMMMSGGTFKAAEAALTCDEVVSQVVPCVHYVANGGPLPSACCKGMKTLKGEAKTKGDRQQVCKCIKSAFKGHKYTKFNLHQLAGLPGKCGLNIPYKIRPSINCNRVR